MPLILDSQTKYKIALKSDKKKPAEFRPCFVFQYLTTRSWRKVSELSDSFERSSNGITAIDTVFEILRIGLVGWENMKRADGTEIEYAPDKLEDILIPREATELMTAVVAQQPSFEDKKKLDLPSDSNTEEPAKAAKESQNAQTSQPQQNL